MKVKITKGRLKQLIKEEIELVKRIDEEMFQNVNKELADDILRIMMGNEEITKSAENGKMTLEEVVRGVSKAYLNFKTEELMEEIFSEEQQDYMVKLFQEYISGKEVQQSEPAEELEEGEKKDA